MKNKFIILSLFTYLASITNINAQINIAINASGTTPDASAILDVNSSTQGLLLPSVTPIQFAALAASAANPANGLMVYNTTTNALNINTGTNITPAFLQLLTSNIKLPFIYTAGTGVGTSSGALSMQSASISPGGYLTSTDYNTFNAKQPYLNNSTLSTLGFVQASTSVAGTTAISYVNTSLCNTTSSSGTAGYYPKYASTTSLSNSLIYEDNFSHVGVKTAIPNSTLQVNGSFSTAVTKPTAGYLILSTDYLILSNGFDVQLPAVSSCAGRIYVIKNINSSSSINIITNPNKSHEFIDNVYYYESNGQKNLYILLPQRSVTLQSNGIGWWIIGVKSI